MHEEYDLAIRNRAYAIWEAEGRPEGQHESHWHRALKELGLVSPAEQPEGTTVYEPRPDRSPLTR